MCANTPRFSSLKGPWTWSKMRVYLEKREQGKVHLWSLKGGSIVEEEVSVTRTGCFGVEPEKNTDSKKALDCASSDRPATTIRGNVIPGVKGTGNTKALVPLRCINVVS